MSQKQDQYVSCLQNYSRIILEREPFTCRCGDGDGGHGLPEKTKGRYFLFNLPPARCTFEAYCGGNPSRRFANRSLTE